MNWKEKIHQLPRGYCEVLYEGKKYSVTCQEFNSGNSMKVYAEEAGGKNFISFNYYITSVAGVLKPCEMPEEKVIHFLENYTETDSGAES